MFDGKTVLRSVESAEDGLATETSKTTRFVLFISPYLLLAAMGKMLGKIVQGTKMHLKGL